MEFNIFSFVFLAILLVVFYILPRVVRPYVLLIASVYYYYHYSLNDCIFLVFESILVYLAGILIYKIRNKDNADKVAKIISGILVVGLIIQLIFFKETNSIAMPIGLSFYTFQMISYITDIGSGKISAEKNPFYAVLSITWFPKIISGPVERVDKLSEQIRNLTKEKLLKDDRLFRGLVYIIYGFFCKLVIADRLGVYVGSIFDNFGSFNTPWLVLGVIFYTIQIYFDFAGYSNIAIGVSEWFGIGLTQNFRTPYFSENITEFWRRWHISLSSWLRDYLYIPLGGSKKGVIRKYINLLIVFIVCGFWHGNGFSFLVWGGLHGLYSICTDFCRRHNISFLIKGWFARIFTLAITAFAWIFFRANSLKDALRYIKRILTAWQGGFSAIGLQREAVGITVNTFKNLMIAIIIIGVFEAIAYKKDKAPAEYLSETNEIFKCLMLSVMAILIFIFGMYGTAATQFIYMQF